MSKKNSQRPAKPRVILADDHAGMLDLVTRMLRGEVDVIATVGNGKDLVGAVHRTPADLLIVDVDMPVMSGFEALVALGQSGDRTPVIILTTSDDSETLEESRRLGAEGFVVKSHMGRDLLPAVRCVLGGETYTSPSLL